MYILGDIGNSETKIFLISLNDKIIKKTTISTKDINLTKLDKLFFNSKIDYKNIKKILFCSVVPKSFNVIKKFLSKKIKLKCHEVKDLNLRSLIKVLSFSKLKIKLIFSNLCFSNKAIFPSLTRPSIL